MLNRGTRRGPEAHSAEIVDGRPTARDKPMDSFQPVMAVAGNLQHAVGLPAESDQPTDDRREERAVPGVEGDVEKDVLPDRGSLGRHRRTMDEGSSELSGP